MSVADAGEPLKNGSGLTNGKEIVNGTGLTSFKWRLVQGDNKKRLDRVDKPSLIRRILRRFF